jgi:hypothetical protein
MKRESEDMSSGRQEKRVRVSFRLQQFHSRDTREDSIEMMEHNAGSKLMNGN